METSEPAEPSPEPQPLTVRLQNGTRVPLVIGGHARDRQTEVVRLVSVDDIIATLQFPERRGLKTQEGRQHWARTERGREVHVVFEVRPDGTVYVVTTFRRP